MDWNTTTLVVLVLCCGPMLLMMLKGRDKRGGKDPDGDDLPRK
jgi:hypothetical protein